MKQMQRGFTLIELVMVIVIIGVLAAVAIPKFVDLRSDAYTASAQGYAGALNSANAINYAGCAAKNGVAATGVCVKVNSCADLGALLQPTVTFTIGAVPSVTTAGTFYMASDEPSSLTGATCTGVLGNGVDGGISFTFLATTT